MTRIVKIITIVFMLCSVMLTISCGYTISVEGIENFSTADSSMGTVGVLLPDAEGDTAFMDMFEYNNGNYYYIERTDSTILIESMERALVYLEYEPSVYGEAKQYCLDHMRLSEENLFEYNGYAFVENIKLFSDKSFEEDENVGFPSRFNMFVYNDDKCTLVFIGFYATMPEHKDAVQLAEDDWGAFLEEYYGEFYSFE